MSKIVLILIAIAVVVGGYYYYQNRPTSLGGMMQQTAGGEFTGNLMEAMSRNIPVKCTYSSGNTSAETYVKGEMMYSQTNTDGKLGYMVRKDGCNYIWGDQVEQGIKICVDLKVSPAPTGQAEVSGPDLAVNYRCLPTVVSDDKFNPPANIQFTDMGEMMNKMMENLPSAPAIPNYNY